MRYYLQIVISTFCLMLIPAQTLARGFGIQQGTSIEELDVVEDLGTGRYVVNVPSPHSEFESYVVWASDSHGVCLVRGLGKDHDNDRYGQSVRAAFDKLESALEERYGDFRKGNFLNAGALWDETDEWVMAIRQSERVYQSVWDAQYGSDLPDSIIEIILNVDALSSSSAWIGLQYRLANFDECQQKLETLDSQGL
jgi:hypothetical protein